MSKWISVEDSLPEDGEMVLVYEPSFAKTDKRERERGYAKRSYGVRLGSYVGGLGYMRPEGCNGRYDVTHWMPLPEPPEIKRRK